MTGEYQGGDLAHPGLASGPAYITPSSKNHAQVFYFDAG